VANSLFQHSDVHTATWLSNTGSHWATLDLVLASRRIRSSITDTRVMPAATAHDTDHRLVVCDVKLRLKAARKPASQPRFNTAHTPDSDAAVAFRAALERGLAQHEATAQPEGDSEVELAAFTSGLKAAAAEHLGLAQQQRGKRPWISPSTVTLSQRKREAHAELLALQAQTPPVAGGEGAAAAAALQAKSAEYRRLNKRARSSARVDRAVMMQRVLAEAQEALKAHQPHRAYSLVDQLTGRARKGGQPTAITTTAGTVQGPQVAAALAQHFEATLNVPTTIPPAQLDAIPADATQLPRGASAVARAATAADLNPHATTSAPLPPPPPLQPRMRPARTAIQRMAVAAEAAAASEQAAAAEAAATAAAEAANGEPPTLEEVCRAVATLRNTSPGLDGIPAQLMKLGGAPAARWLRRVLSATWASGRAPAAWKRALLVPIHKKGSQQQADNYRGVTLLEVCGKAYVSIIHRRVRRHLCRLLRGAQFGFKPGSGTGGALFSIRRIQELSRDSGQPLFAAFVDFRKAFDSVNREVLWRVLAARGVSPKLLALMRDLYAGCEACVQVNGGVSSWFPMATGVRQGCPMSPTLFNTFFDFLTRQVEERCAALGVGGVRLAFRMHEGRLQQAPGPGDSLLSLLMLLYADDLVLLADSEAALQTALQQLEATAADWGMQLNAAKTEAVAFGLRQEQRAQLQPLQVAGGQVGWVDSFNYLGSLQSASGQQEQEISRRLSLAGWAFNRLRTVLLKGRGCNTSFKSQLLKTLVLPILTYGAPESWAPTQAQLHRMDVFGHSCCRRMLGVRRMEHVSNEQVESRTRVPAISAIIRKLRARWVGHVARMHDTALPKQLLFATRVVPAQQGGSGREGASQGLCSWGRAGDRASFVKIVQQDLDAAGIEGFWYELAQCRPQWSEVWEPSA
jgi:hypothetical protein